MGVTRKQKIKRDEDKSTSPAPYSSSGSPDTKSGKHNDRKKRKKTQYDYDICLPAHGKTYLAIGQDLYSIQEYLTEQQVGCKRSQKCHCICTTILHMHHFHTLTPVLVPKIECKLALVHAPYGSRRTRLQQAKRW